MTITPQELDCHYSKTVEHIKIFHAVATKVNSLVDEKERIPPRRLLLHDASKFNPQESLGYASKFCADETDEWLWQSALRSHYLHNPHHPENWLISLEHPQLTEMVADWIAASLQYTGSLDISDWLTENLESKLELADENDMHRVVDILLKLGYDHHNSCQWEWRTPWDL